MREERGVNNITESGQDTGMQTRPWGLIDPQQYGTASYCTCVTGKGHGCVQYAALVALSYLRLDDSEVTLVVLSQSSRQRNLAN